MIVTLDRPDKRNAMNAAMVRRLAETLGEADEDNAVEVVILTGAGNASFSAGADMRERLEDPDSLGTWPAIDAATAFSKPLIAAVNGLAHGGGAVLAVACDLRIGCERSGFRFVGAKYGLVAGAAHLPRVVGASRAKELLFTARLVESEEALRIGLLNRIVPQDTLISAVSDIADLIAENSSDAVRGAKRVVDSALAFEEARALEADNYAKARASADHRMRFEGGARNVLGDNMTEDRNRE